MSDQRDSNLYDVLNAEEARSEEESVMGSDTADFYVADSLDEVPLSTSMPSDQGQDSILVPPDTSVSIFNTLSDPEGMNKDEGERQGDWRVAGGKRMSSQTLFAGRRTEAGGDRGGMRLGELNPSVTGISSVLSTISGNTKLPPIMGEATKMDGLADQTRGVQMSQTRDYLKTRPIGASKISAEDGGGKASGLKLSNPPIKQPKELDRPKGKGGVAMAWEPEEEEEETAPAGDPSWKTVMEGLERDALAKEDLLTTTFEDLAFNSHARSVHLGYNLPEMAAARGEVLDLHADEGILGLLLMSAEEQESLRVNPVDLAAKHGAAWKTEWQMFAVSKKTDFEGNEVVGLMAETSRLLPGLADDLESYLGREAVGELIARHRQLEAGLNGAVVNRTTAALFPRHLAGAIMEWYVRFVAGLTELKKVKERAVMATMQVGNFLALYPGPKGAAQEGNSWRRDLGRTLLGGSLSRAHTSEGGHGFGQTRGAHGSSGQAHGVHGMGQTFEAHGGDQASAGRGSVRSAGVRDAGASGKVTDGMEAALSGYDFRPGSRPPLVSSVFGPQHQTPNGGPFMHPDLVRPKHRLKESGLSIHNSDHDQSEGHSDYETSEVDDSQCVSGFEGMDRKEILDVLQGYCEERLTEGGQMSELTVAAIMDNFPQLGMYPKKGKEEVITRGFSRAVKDIKPQSEKDKNFIGVAQWLRQINYLADDNGWSIPTRIRFLMRTGGLAAKVNDDVRERVLDFMRETKDWLPNYDSGRNPKDNQYWLPLWIDVCVKIVVEFHSYVHADDIEEGIEKLLNADKYVFKSKTNPVNEDFHRVVTAYQDLNTWLRERNSELVNSPLYVFDKLRRWLTSHGRGGVGRSMVNHIDKALSRLSTDPASVFPDNHHLSAYQLTDIRRKGQGQASSATYKMVLEKLKQQAATKSLSLEIFSLVHAEELGLMTVSGDDKSTKDQRRARTTRAVNSVALSTSLVSAITANTTMGASAATKYPSCPDCAMFHDLKSGKCLFWDKAKRIFLIEGFLKHRSARKILADGTSVLNPFWKQKLEYFGFPAMKITKESEKKMIIDDLNTALEKMPVASKDEINRYAAQNSKFINLTHEEEKGSGVSKKQRKKQRQQERRKADAESSSDDEYGSDGSFHSDRS